MTDYYKTLGVERGASPEDIKRAYRKLASLYHPDKEGGSKTKFQEVEEAYRTLGDANKRAQYDNPQPQFNGFGGFGHQQTPFDIDAIFNMFGARFNHPHQQMRQQARMTLWITLEDAAQGGRRNISVGTQHGTTAVEIEIPQGIEDGDNVQYSGVGPGGMDLIIGYRIHPNPRWHRRGHNLTTEIAISIWDLVLGRDVEITDILGKAITLTIPPRTQPGTTMRLRGKGMPVRNSMPGDLMVKVQAQIPDNIDNDLLALIEKNRSQ